MKVLPAIAATALTATLLSATPSQAQFFDPLFAAPAVAAGVAAGAVGAATGVATGGYHGSPYYNGYNSGYGYGDGYPNYFGAGSYAAPGYDTGFWVDTPTYAPAAPTYAPSYTTNYVDQPAPIRTGRSAAAARRNYKSGRDNPYQ